MKSSSTPREYLFGLELFGIKFGLENIRTLVASLGHPDRAFDAVHVAGTNGKGSVTAFVDAALRAAGRRTARYTSPHLVDLTERFVIDGRPVSDEALASAIDHVRAHIGRLMAAGALRAQPTFFEVTTAVALELFRRAGVEVAVLEVGLGGRLDATNVITPKVAVITSIAFDHEQYLGHTLREIAAEKAGIIKPGVPVIAGRLDEEAEAAIAAVAAERGAELVHAWDGVTAGRLPGPRGDTRVRLRTPVRDYGDVAVSLRGDHQIGNAVVAVRLLERLDREGVAVPAEAIVAGLAAAAWPGRLDERRLPDGREMILDAAHNPAGAASLAAYLADETGEKPPMVFAVMADKDVPAMFSALLPAVSALILTRASTARSADPESLARHAAAIAPALPVLVRPRRSEALAAAWRISPRIVVAGSIFLLGDVMKEFHLS